MHLFVGLHDLNPQAPVVRDFLDRRVEDVPNLRIARREVPGIDARELPSMRGQSRATHPGLPAVVMDRTVDRYIAVVVQHLEVVIRLYLLKSSNAYNVAGFDCGARK